MRIGYLELTRAAPDLPTLLAPCSPAVEPDGALAAYFDAAGMEQYFGSLARYGQALLGATGDAAARLGLGEGKWFAQAAARCADPGVMQVITPAGAARFAAPLPVDWLPLPTRAVATLAALGVRTIGQFAALPRHTLSPRLGREALLAHRIAGGEDPRPLQPLVASEAWGASHRWEPPLSDRTALLAVAMRLLEPLCRRLRAEGASYRALAVTMELEDGQHVNGSRQLRQPTDTGDAAHTVLHDLLPERATAPVAAITLTLLGRAPRLGEQHSLLPETVRSRQRTQVERVTQDLLRRYPGHLGRLLSTSPHHPLPEQRWRFTVTRGDAAIRLQPRGGQWAIQIAGRWDRLTTSRQLWHLDLWWPQRHHRRYLQLATQGGQHLTVYYDSLEQGWFLAERLD